MPGVIMDQGSRNGSHTNHDRSPQHNTVNGVISTSEKTQEKGKGRAEPQQNMTPISPTIPNGMNGNISQASQLVNGAEAGHPSNRLGELPPEILHITEGYMSLAGLLKRLAQHTHSGLQDVITQLASMPMPASVLNGNSSQPSEDNSPENLAKKKLLLDYVTNTHESWTKALVIAGWSRKADEVSRAVDIKMHEQQESILYKIAIDDMANKKREFATRRAPNPDLKTAVPVLTTGKAHWMPDLGYIPPPPLTSREVLQSLEKLNTILSMRLNLDDYDNIPLQFKDFTVNSGRVTFKVDGEFELDVTVADEDPQSQFWFIDFRFIFGPSSGSLPPRIRSFVENKINEILLADGLSGCYKYLHEMILTYKIAEFRRQAFDLGRAKWVETLKVEALNRAISVQYWLDRYNGLGSKSWIIIGVRSGKPENGRPDPKSTSRLFLRWFRDQKEVKDVDITFDTVNLSMEALLKVVIARHINHILSEIFDKLKALPLYATGELSLSLAKSSDDPAKPELKIQLTNERKICLKIDPICGRYVFSPPMLIAQKWEVAMNAPSRDSRDPTGRKFESAIDKGLRTLESLRYAFISDDIASRGVTVGWKRVQDPGIKRGVLFEAIPKTTQFYIWLRRSAWAEDWYLLPCTSMSGIDWFLMKLKKQATPLDPNPNALGIDACLKIPITTVSPTIDYGFLTTLTIFTSGLLSHYANLKILHARRVHQVPYDGKSSKALSIPSIYIRVSDLFHVTASKRPKTSWKKDIIKLTYQGIEMHAPDPTPALLSSNEPLGASQSMAANIGQKPSRDEKAVLVTQARMTIPMPRDLASLKEKLDPDIAFHAPTGTFAFRLHSPIGEPIIPTLMERILSVDRLVDFLRVFQKYSKILKSESISLGTIIFNYSQAASTDSNTESSGHASPRYRATVDFSAGNDEMKLILENSNPHLRIVDYLNHVLNGGEGLYGVASLLYMTLPVLRGLDAIEDAWDDDELCEKGEAFIIARAIDWYTIKYSLRQGAQDSVAPPNVRKVQFEVRMRSRRGAAWWFVHRVDNIRSKEVDNLDKAISPIWNASGQDWKSMRTSAVARHNGVVQLVTKLDEAVRQYAMSGVPIRVESGAEAPKQAPKQAPPPRPQQYQQQQQRQQQPTPNQSQSQSQSRGPLKREYVEID